MAFLGQTPALVRVEAYPFALGVELQLFPKNTIWALRFVTEATPQFGTSTK